MAVFPTLEIRPMHVALPRLTVIATFLALTACSQPDTAGEDTVPEAEVEAEVAAPTGRDTITAQDLHEQIRILASDEFEGRAPSSPAETKTINYLKEQLVSFGVKPGNGDSYFQEVPLVDITAEDVTPLTIEGEGGSLSYDLAVDMVALTRRVVDRIDLEKSPLVFVGYGIVAPEHNWNDYEGVDMTGKTAVILVNDPGYATQDPAVFDGNAMTYYGRWTYKYEEAMRQGADGAIIIHETAAAAYPWVVVKNGWTGRNFYAETADGNMSRTKVEGWISTKAAQEIFALAGLDYEEQLTAAIDPAFTPVPMPLTASVGFNNVVGHSLSNNVVGVVPGSAAPDEAFIYMGHWDHFGIGDAEDGDDIYNGAVDNATGTAALLELAQAFASLETAPRRSVYFLYTTAEEQGLLGSEYYAENPLYPLAKTVAGLNVDAFNTAVGPTHDVGVIGTGLSELDGVLKSVTDASGRVITPDSSPEKGFYFRSDHFPLAKKGVPMIYPKNGVDSIEHGEEWGKQVLADYVANTYHKPTDEYQADWDLTGMANDVGLFFDVGYEVANGDAWPNWNPGTQFRSIRDESLAP